MPAGVPYAIPSVGTAFVVIERRIRPRDSVMTKLAGGREARVRHRTFRIVEIILVARNAERAIQVVVIVHVAVRACPRRNRMGTRQRKTGLRVIELAIRPLDCVMAILASRREAGVRHWTFRIVVVGLVATRCRSCRQRCCSCC